MIPDRIDTKIILKVTLNDGTSRFVGPPSFSCLRWPTKSDFNAGKVYALIDQKNAGSCNRCGSSVPCMISKENKHTVQATPIKTIENNHIDVTFEKKDIEYQEVCFDILNKQNIPIDQIKGFEFLRPIDKELSSLSIDDCNEINEKILSDILPEFLELKNLDSNNPLERQKIGAKINFATSREAFKSIKILEPAPVKYSTAPTSFIDKKPKFIDAKIYHSLETTDKKEKEIDVAYEAARFQALLNKEGQSESKNKKSKGLGDTIKKITEKMGIKQCGGCKKRQEWLNKYFPYKK